MGEGAILVARTATRLVFIQSPLSVVATPQTPKCSLIAPESRGRKGLSRAPSAATETEASPRCPTEAAG